MKTITEIKQHFSDNEIKLCVDIIKGKLEFSVLEEQIKDFYAEENIDRDKLLDQLESDFDFGDSMIHKTMKQLMAEKHWSVQGLKDNLKITDKEVETWAKLNKQYKKSKKRYKR